MIGAMLRPLKTADLCDLFGVSRLTIAAWWRKGYLPKPRRMGKKLYWDPVAIDALFHSEQNPAKRKKS